MREKRVILDCDGVVFDYHKGFSSFMKDHYGVYLDPKGPDSYDMRAWTGLGRTRLAARMLEFHRGGSQTGFNRIPLLPGALEGVMAFLDAGYEIDILSSAFAGGTSRHSRNENLDMHFGDVFGKREIIMIGRSKLPYLKAYGPSIFVDDHPSNIRDGLLCGHSCHVIRQPQNVKNETDTSIAGSLWHDRLDAVAEYVLREDMAA